MNMNDRQTHPNMMPFSQKTLDSGRAGIAHCRNLIKEFSRQNAVKHNSRIANKDGAFARNVQPVEQPALRQYQMAG